MSEASTLSQQMKELYRAGKYTEAPSLAQKSLALTPGVSKYVDAIVAMTPTVMATSAKLNTANDQSL